MRAWNSLVLLIVFVFVSLNTSFATDLVTEPTPSPSPAVTPAPTQDQTQIPKSIAEEKAYNCTYRLYFLQDFWNGSAWILKTKESKMTVAITAAHCVLDSKSGEPITNTWWLGHPSWEGQKRLRFTLLAYDKVKDVAILGGPADYNLEGLEIEGMPIQFGDGLLLMGNSLDIPPHTPLVGNYIARITAPQSVTKQPERDFDVITNFTRPGCSGAPVVNAHGRVVCMVYGHAIFQSNGFRFGTGTPRDYIIEVAKQVAATPSVYTEILKKESSQNLTTQNPTCIIVPDPTNPVEFFHDPIPIKEEYKPLLED